MSKFIDARVIQKTGSESEWLANDLILYKGELALVTQGDRVINIKVGNGTKKFSELPYIYNGGFTDSVTPTTQGSALVDGMYIANGAGTYTNMGRLVVKEGYFTIISKVGTTYKIASEVKMPTPDLTPIENRITEVENNVEDFIENFSVEVDQELNINSDNAIANNVVTESFDKIFNNSITHIPEYSDLPNNSIIALNYRVDLTNAYILENESFACYKIPVKQGDSVKFIGFTGQSTVSASNPYPVISFWGDSNGQNFISRLAESTKSFSKTTYTTPLIFEGVAPRDGWIYVTFRRKYTSGETTNLINEFYHKQSDEEVVKIYTTAEEGKNLSKIESVLKSFIDGEKKVIDLNLATNNALKIDNTLQASSASQTLHNIDVIGYEKLTMNCVGMTTESINVSNYAILLGVKDNVVTVILNANSSSSTWQNPIQETFDISNFDSISICLNKSLNYQHKISISNAINEEDSIYNAIYGVDKFTLQSDENYIQSNAINPLSTIDISQYSRMLKPIVKGIYMNIGNNIIGYRNGKLIGKVSNEISNSELRDFEVYFYFDKENSQWYKITQKKKENTNPLEILSDDITGAWCWFGSPNFFCTEDKTLIGVVSPEEGKQAVIEYNHTTNVATKTILGTVFDKDDHNQPSFAQLSDGRFIAVYCGHNWYPYFNFRISTNPNDGVNWGAEQTVATAVNCTYSHVFKLANGKIINIYRQGSTGAVAGKWCYRELNESNMTFGEEIELMSMQGGYAIPYQDDLDRNIIHILCTKLHPNWANVSNEINNVFYFKFNALSKKVYKANGVETGVLPMVISQSNTSIEDLTNNSIARTNNYWVEDICVYNGKPRVLYLSYPKSYENNSIKKELFYRKFDTIWQEPIKITEPLFGYVQTTQGETTNEEPQYSTGASFDNLEMNVIWCPIQVADKMEIFKIDISNGLNFKQKTFNSVNSQWRPIVTNSESNKLVMWQDQVYYDYFTDRWNQKIVIAKE